MSNVEVDVEGVESAIIAVENLPELVLENFRLLVAEESEALASQIEDKANQMGLNESGELTNSFKSVPLAGPRGSDKWVVTSTADHALPLETGTGKDGPSRQRYPITPKSANLLRFEVDNPRDYPWWRTEKILLFKQRGRDMPNTWYDPEAQAVFSVGLLHPGVESYEYITKAQTRWEMPLGRKVDETATEAIVASGFRPSGSVR